MDGVCEGKWTLTRPAVLSSSRVHEAGRQEGEVRKWPGRVSWESRDGWEEEERFGDQGGEVIGGGELAKRGQGRGKGYREERGGKKMELMWNKCRGDKREGGEVREEEKEGGVGGDGEEGRGEGRERWRERLLHFCVSELREPMTAIRVLK